MGRSTTKEASAANILQLPSFYPSTSLYFSSAWWADGFTLQCLVVSQIIGSQLDWSLGSKKPIYYFKLVEDRQPRGVLPSKDGREVMDVIVNSWLTLVGEGLVRFRVMGIGFQQIQRKIVMDGWNNIQFQLLPTGVSNCHVYLWSCCWVIPVQYLGSVHLLLVLQPQASTFSPSLQYTASHCAVSSITTTQTALQALSPRWSPAFHGELFLSLPFIDACSSFLKCLQINQLYSSMLCTKTSHDFPVVFL